jgi:hypothetical protein
VQVVCTVGCWRELVGRVQCVIYGRAGHGIAGVSLVRRLLHVTGLRIAGEG